MNDAHGLFSSGSSGPIGAIDYGYWDVTLTEPVGKFPVGTQFPSAELWLSTGKLVLKDSGGAKHTYPLVIGIGDTSEEASGD